MRFPEYMDAARVTRMVKIAAQTIMYCRCDYSLLQYTKYSFHIKHKHTTCFAGSYTSMMVHTVRRESAFPGCIDRFYSFFVGNPPRTGPP